jgi:gamma-glutamylcyclotransferase (GGCT)/AIG2-like uncharacterized protein YtfP/DNA-binding XRE family transcriptional regulator
MPRTRERFYLAYGSNMNVEQMSRRCPRAAVVGVSRISDYRLCFKGAGFATIEPHEGEYVPVVVWKLTPNCERALDLYEGVSTGHYFKEMMRVSVAGQEVEAMVYIMNLEADYSTPSRGYFEAVKQGYRSFGLDEKKLYTALETHKQTSKSANPLRCYRNSCGLTQQKLSEITGLSIKRIQKYESGDRLLSKAQAEAVLSLADALGVEPRQLVSE